MKTKLIMMSALVALLATGCAKDKIATRVSLFAENMTTVGNGSKIFMDPTNVNNGHWNVGEPISISNGTDVESFDISYDDLNSCYHLEGVTVEGTRYAIYPATYSENNNDVDVENNGDAGTITLHELAVNFRDNGHDIIFPMAAKASSEAGTLNFYHLTAGFMLTLKATTPVEGVSKVEVIVYSDEDQEENPVNITGVGNYTVKWAVQGATSTLPLPNGGIGTGANQDMRYASKMVFNMKEGYNDYVDINATGKTFCVPVTMAKMNRITVIGYDYEGEELFNKTTSTNNSRQLEVNKMYSIPDLTIN